MIKKMLCVWKSQFKVYKKTPSVLGEVVFRGPKVDI